MENHNFLRLDQQTYPVWVFFHCMELAFCAVIKEPIWSHGQKVYDMADTRTYSGCIGNPSQVFKATEGFWGGKMAASPALALVRPTVNNTPAILFSPPLPLSLSAQFPLFGSFALAPCQGGQIGS